MAVSDAKGDALVKAFNHDRERYEAFTENLSTLISNLMRATSIEHLAIEKRTKTIASLKSKIERPDKSGKYKLLEDVTDLSGIRVIVFYERDVERVRQIVRDNFDVDEKNSVDKSKQLSPDRFGYLSDHYVVQHSETRAGLTENRQFSGLKAEVQVRTAVQHAWAAIDRSLRYNNDDDIPDEVKRQLFRVSALLELADKEFMSIVDRITELRSTYSEAIHEGELDFKINKDSSQAFLVQSKVVEKVLSAADKAAVRYHRDFAYQAFGSLLTKFCKAAGIVSIEQLSMRLDSMEDKLPKIMLAISNSDIFNKGVVRIPVEAVVIITATLSLSEDEIRKLSEKGSIAGGTDNIIREYIGLEPKPDNDDDDDEEDAELNLRD